MHEYPHISFQKHWLLDEETIFMLGPCESIIQAISSAPVKPEYRKRMPAVSLRKGGPRRLQQSPCLWYSPKTRAF
jgi:hypothetical protein